MDLRITGKFIQERRKEKKLTQVQLAEKLNVSEKTISKWECGNGFPDTTLILPLCKALGISANELLSGKLLKDEKEYRDTAEENLLILKDKQEKDTRFLLTLEWVVDILSIIILLTGCLIASYAELHYAWRLVIIFAGMLICFVGVYFCIIIEKNAGYYECEHCHNKYIPSYKQIYFSMHIGRTRYMKCPKCGKHSWNKKTIK